MLKWTAMMKERLAAWKIRRSSGRMAGTLLCALSLSLCSCTGGLPKLGGEPAGQTTAAPGSSQRAGQFEGEGLHFSELPTVGVQAQDLEPEDLRSINGQVRAFAEPLFQEARRSGKNYVASPLSAWLCFQLYQGGLSGERAAELQAVLEKNGPLADREAQIAGLLQRVLRTDGGLELMNLLLTRQGRELDPAYRRYLASFHAAHASADFARAGESVRQGLNAWIAEHTAQLIPEFWKQALDPETELILVNSLCYQGLWHRPFAAERTHKQDFQRADGSRVQVDMMQMKTEIPDLNYATDELGAYLRLDYQNGASMILALPSDPAGNPADLLEHMADWRLEFARRTGEVRMPRFRLQSDYDLLRILRAAGLDASLKGGQGFFSDGQPLAISGSQQQAVIEVDEQGTRAAAVTDVEMEAMALLENDGNTPISFICDRPFAFLISSQGQSLFEGVVQDPTAMN